MPRQSQTQPNDGSGTSLLTAFILDHDGDVSSVVVDLSPISVGSSQQMYDDGTHGDVNPGDGTYSYLATITGGTPEGFKTLVVTANDTAANTGKEEAKLYVGEPGAIYLDNEDADFECSWTYKSGVSGAYDENHSYHAAGDGSCTATWTPDLPEATYKLYGWWRAHENWATNAPYTIHYDGGSETVEVNQEINGSQWNLLGTYPFAAGTSGEVILSNDGDQYVVADAIKFKPVP